MTFVSRLALLTGCDTAPNVYIELPSGHTFQVAFLIMPVTVSRLPTGNSMYPTSAIALPPDPTARCPCLQIYFASCNGPVPDLAYQVDFPRLEIVLEGWNVDTGASQRIRLPLLVAGFSTMASPRYYTFSVLFGKQQLGSASCNGMANNIKSAVTSPARSTHRFFFCYKRSMIR